jgi:hypothetical protein
MFDKINNYYGRRRYRRRRRKQEISVIALLALLLIILYLTNSFPFHRRVLIQAPTPAYRYYRR